MSLLWRQQKPGALPVRLHPCLFMAPVLPLYPLSDKGPLPLLDSKCQARVADHRVPPASLCCKLVLALPDFKPTQAQASQLQSLQRLPPCRRRWWPKRHKLQPGAAAASHIAVLHMVQQLTYCQSRGKSYGEVKRGHKHRSRWSATRCSWALGLLVADDGQSQIKRFRPLQSLQPCGRRGRHFPLSNFVSRALQGDSPLPSTADSFLSLYPPPNTSPTPLATARGTAAAPRGPTTHPWASSPPASGPRAAGTACHATQ